MSFHIYEDIIGETIVRVEGLEYGSEFATFYLQGGLQFTMYHQQDCCESVSIEEVIGDVDDLIGSPLLMAEEVEQQGESEWGSATWTFYKFATNKGSVDIRWLGESNGYYSESVSTSLEKVDWSERF